MREHAYIFGSRGPGKGWMHAWLDLRVIGIGGKFPQLRFLDLEIRTEVD